MSAGPPTTARSKAGCKPSSSVAGTAANTGKPTARNAENHRAVRSPKRPAATRAGAGVPSGVTIATSVVVRNGTAG